MSDCYIYYRVARTREADARRAVHAMLADVEASTGIRGHACCKPDEPLLWMEVYRGVDAAFVPMLSQLSARHGLDACLEDNQKRHVEEFVPLDNR